MNIYLVQTGSAFIICEAHSEDVKLWETGEMGAIKVYCPLRMVISHDGRVNLTPPFPLPEPYIPDWVLVSPSIITQMTADEVRNPTHKLANAYVESVRAFKAASSGIIIPGPVGFPTVAPKGGKGFSRQ